MFSSLKHKECFDLFLFTCPLWEYRSYSSVCLIPVFAAYSPPSSLCHQTELQHRRPMYTALEMSNTLLQSSMSTQTSLSTVPASDSTADVTFEAQVRNLTSRINVNDRLQDSWLENLDQISKGSRDCCPLTTNLALQLARVCQLLVAYILISNNPR